jgi:hypothetical protein
VLEAREQMSERLLTGTNAVVRVIHLKSCEKVPFRRKGTLARECIERQRLWSVSPHFRYV